MNSYKAYFFFSILSLIILINGCNAVNSVKNPSTPTEGSMTATVNGEAWASAPTTVPSVTGGATASMNTPLQGALTITGVCYYHSVPITDIKGETPQTITITLIHPHLGADSMSTANSFDPNTGSFLYGTNAKDAYLTIPNQGDTGSINITKYDTTNKLISGTFSFTATQEDTMSHTIQVTNGSFNDVSW